MAVYMTGDIHGNPSRFYDLKSFCKVHSDAEWFICLGDVGLNYYGEDHPQEMYIKNPCKTVLYSWQSRAASYRSRWI